MCTIQLKQIMLNNSLPDAGNVLYDSMVQCIANNEKVVIDMANVESLPSMFLNTSIGRYMKENGADSLQGKMSFVGISVTQISRLKEYMAKVAENL